MSNTSTPNPMKNRIHSEGASIFISKAKKHWSFRKPRLNKSEPVKVLTEQEWALISR